MILANVVTMIGSLFITKNKTTGDIVINAAPFIALSVCAVTVGCATGNEPFSECVVSSLSELKELFGL